MREFTAMTRNCKGGTEAVTVDAASKDLAIAKLISLGYFEVIWIL